jgi:uncharacterized repeat protein (TIGR03803 family)
MKRGHAIYGCSLLLALALQPRAVSQQSATQSPQAGYQVLHKFHDSPDGASPVYELVRDSAGNLYGVTISGGTQNLGTVYKVGAAGKETVLHRFSNKGTDGNSPFAPLTLDAAGNLYGSTGNGGVAGAGSLFKISPAGKETTLYSFAGGKHSASPAGRLALDDAGNLYGTASGGALGMGTVFKVTPAGRETVLHSFRWADGFRALGGVVRDSEGNLYGTTEVGGKTFACNCEGCGTVFKLDKTGKYTVLHSFTGGSDDGGHPAAGVIRDAAGNLYGTASLGGDPNCGVESSGCGVVFKLDRNGKETVLHSFTGGKDGAYPGAQLFQDDAGSLYGTTAFGGDNNQLCDVIANGCGVVFKIDTAGKFTTLYAFKGYPSRSGGEPAGGVIRDPAGNLYGVTSIGGDLNCQPVNGCGVVFKLTP